MTPSHVCELRARELCRMLAGPLFALGLFAAALHAGARLALLPAPRPTLDVDRTVLIHQADASRTWQDAEIVLIGDSSCLMDVAAPLLTRRLGRPVLNLGTLSYLSLDAYALLLHNCAEANPGRLRAVVLLMHPEALRVAHPDTWQDAALRAYLAGADLAPHGGLADRVGEALGVHILRGRILARSLPRPLPGPFGPRYGFTHDLERHLTRHRGSAIDPDWRAPSGRPEYRLAAYYESAAPAFRDAVPPGVPLLVGITPVPEVWAGAAYPARHAALLEQWSALLRADAALTTLPGTLPEALFAQKTHLNERGQELYTEHLARAVESLRASDAPQE